MPCSTASNELWGGLDFVVHAIAFSDREQLTGRYVDTTADNFSKTMLISCYSLTAIAQRAQKLMTDGGSILTLTYYGAEKVMPHYNVMGVAKAALEASVRYLAVDLGKQRHPRQRHLVGPDQDARRRRRHRRLPLHPEVERIQRAAAQDRHHRGGRRRRALSALRPVPRRDRRNPPRRFRLSRRRHEGGRRPGHRLRLRPPSRRSAGRRHPCPQPPRLSSSATARPTGTSKDASRASTTCRSTPRAAARPGTTARPSLREIPEAVAFDFVASPLGRARETMEIARTAMGLDPTATASTSG